MCAVFTMSLSGKSKVRGFWRIIHVYRYFLLSLFFSLAFCLNNFYCLRTQNASFTLACTLFIFLRITIFSSSTFLFFLLSVLSFEVYSPLKAKFHSVFLSSRLPQDTRVNKTRTSLRHLGFFCDPWVITKMRDMHSRSYSASI